MMLRRPGRAVAQRRHHVGAARGRQNDINVRAHSCTCWRSWVRCHHPGGADHSIHGLDQVDPLLSIVIGALIVWTAWDIIQESLNILLEGLPRGLQLQSVIDAMGRVEGVWMCTTCTSGAWDRAPTP